MTRQSDKIKQIAAQYYAQLLLEQPNRNATPLDLSSLIHDNGALRYNFQMIANERLEAIGGSSFGMPFGNTAEVIVQWIKYWDELRIRRYIAGVKYWAAHVPTAIRV